jgi:hypothetical protein
MIRMRDLSISMIGSDPKAVIEVLEKFGGKIQKKEVEAWIEENSGELLYILQNVDETIVKPLASKLKMAGARLGPLV